MLNESLLTFTDKAAARVAKLVELEPVRYRLRIYITGGGCNGFQYGFTFDENQNDDDLIINNEKYAVELIVDPISLQYLIGATIDFEEGLMGNKFTVQNPSASSTCGCGASFSI